MKKLVKLVTIHRTQMRSCCFTQFVITVVPSEAVIVEYSLAIKFCVCTVQCRFAAQKEQNK